MAGSKDALIYTADRHINKINSQSAQLCPMYAKSDFKPDKVME